MAKIASFEDLKVWQKARELVNILYDLTVNLPQEEKFNLIDQMRRAVVSITANIAEGFSRYHLAESIMFYRNARGSLSELKSHLYVCFDRQYIDEGTLGDLFSKIDEVGKMLNGLINKTETFRKTRL
ncbi:four helix bundle protein [Candidatus Microgenomates bacterium]|nr:four helix bundle protein [Candidatus Microgenomates bacterium]